MSIERIGKGPNVGATQGTSPSTSVSTERGFELDRPTKVAASSTAAVSPAERVRTGELSLSAYVDLRVDEATRHLSGKLGEGDLAQVREMLRAQIANDPAIAEMVKAATGKATTELEEG